MKKTKFVLSFDSGMKIMCKDGILKFTDCRNETIVRDAEKEEIQKCFRNYADHGIWRTDFYQVRKSKDGMFRVFNLNTSDFVKIDDKQVEYTEEKHAKRLARVLNAESENL